MARGTPLLLQHRSKPVKHSCATCRKLSSARRSRHTQMMHATPLERMYMLLFLKEEVDCPLGVGVLYNRRASTRGIVPVAVADSGWQSLKSYRYSDERRKCCAACAR